MAEIPETPRRKTWQQSAVRDALEETDGFVSAQQLHASLRDTGSTIGLATVYRALAGMAASGEADSLLSQTGETLFRACATDTHHHHLICRVCGATVEIAAKVVEEWSQWVAQTHGYTDASHEIDIFGVCPECQKKK